MATVVINKSETDVVYKNPMKSRYTAPYLDQ